MKKYRSYVCAAVVFGVGFISLLTIAFAVFFLCVDWDNIQAQVGISSFVLLLIGFPAIVFLCVFIAFIPKLTFSEMGIEKHFFCIPLKKYKWAQVADIKIIRTSVGAQWLFFSKSDLGNHGLDYCRFHPKTIYIAIDDKKMKKIKEFIPQDKTIREHKSKWLQ